MQGIYGGTYLAADDVDAGFKRVGNVFGVSDHVLVEQKTERSSASRRNDVKEDADIMYVP